MGHDVSKLHYLERIGEGGMATVWKAWDEDHGRYVAVKVLNKEYYSSEDDIASFCTEAKRMVEIRHPGIVPAFDFGHADGIWYFVMEYVDGYTFGDLLRRKQHVRESDCLLICESVATALDYVWNEHGLVHCDIKPENIMINTEGIIKLTDLGISHRFEQIDATTQTPDHVLGTPAYISPEQIYGDVELDCRADIYSLAATIFHLATGRILFPGLDNDACMRAHCDALSQARDPRTYRPELSEGFCQLLEAMLVKDRDYRVTSWRGVCEMCRDVESGQLFKPRDPTAPSSLKLL